MLISIRENRAKQRNLNWMGLNILDRPIVTWQFTVLQNHGRGRSKGENPANYVFLQSKIREPVYKSQKQAEKTGSRQKQEA